MPNIILTSAEQDLKDKLDKRLKLLIDKGKRRAKANETTNSKQRTRRLILIGASLEAMAKTDDEARAVLLKIISNLQNGKDKKLFVEVKDETKI